MEFEVIDSPTTELGEGPFWDERRARLGFVDITRGLLHLQDASGTTTITTLPDLSAAAPVNGHDDRWLVAHGGEIAILRPDGMLSPIVSTGEDASLRLNDGKCDALGRFWVGSMGRDPQPGLGSLYRVDLDGSVTRVEMGLTLSNGLGWSPDQRTFYLVDTLPGLLLAWDFDLDTGSLRNKRLLNDAMGDGLPDGLAVDDDGNLWIAFCGGGAVRRFDRSGRLIDEHRTAMSLPTCPAFGGVDGGTLYVTSATLGLSADELAAEPLAGRLVAAKPGVTGRPANPSRIVASATNP